MANQVLYGFYNLQDLFNQRLSENNNLPTVETAVQATVAEHQRQMDAIIGLFADKTTAHTARFKTPGIARLQPLDEQGRARPIRGAGHYDVGFPLLRGGAALGWTYEQAAKKTVQEANNEMATILGGDSRWVRDQILGALYADDDYDFIDDEHGTINVKGAANGDTDTYLIKTGGDTSGVEDHVIAQASGIDDSHNPFGDIYSDLTEHPENNGAGATVISLIPTGLKDDVEDLDLFKMKTDPDITLGNSSDQLTGNLGVPVPGNVLGKVNGVWIVEWASLPASDIIISVAVGGEKALKMREPEEAILRGYKQEGDTEQHYPFYRKNYVRRAGFGAWNRVGWRIDRVGNGSYAVPTGYECPIP